MTSEARELRPLRVAVLTVSDTRNENTDKSGALLVERLRKAGHVLAAKTIVRDDVYAIRAIVSAWIADSEVEVVITTGGTGLTGRDGTPELSDGFTHRGSAQNLFSIKTTLIRRFFELARRLLHYWGPLGPTPTKGTVKEGFLVPLHRPF